VELFGRDAELAAIDEVLVSARAGRGRAYFVTGEAGIGKSSVLASVRSRAGATVLDGAAWESPGAPPYWPWIQVLRGAGLAHLLEERTGGDAARLEPSAARFTLVDTVARALVRLATERPLVIVLDDLHAADLPSLELLDLLCRARPSPSWARGARPS
jgi:predicted ATPase